MGYERLPPYVKGRMYGADSIIVGGYGTLPPARDSASYRTPRFAGYLQGCGC